MLAATAARASLIEPLLDSEWLKRIGRISFLGTLDAQPDARERTSRLDHSVAVAEWAHHLGLGAGLSGERLTTFVLAALLHDVGHFPLSHSAEAAFARAFGGTHHDVTRWIVLGGGPVSASRSLRSSIGSVGADPVAVWALIAGEPQMVVPEGLAACFSSVLNLDTLEAIPRVARAFGLPHAGSWPVPFAVVNGELVIPSARIAAADRFWQLKDQVYVHVVNRASNIVFEDAVSTAAASLRPEALGPLESLDDEAFLAASEPFDIDLADADRKLRVVPDERGSRTRKRYRVDESVTQGPAGLPVTAWHRRYVHFRERVTVVPSGEGGT